MLERPKDDPAGYDVLFIDAASKGAFASRMSHSCTPNCQAITMACGGRLTIALYTLRHVHPGGWVGSGGLAWGCSAELRLALLLAVSNTVYRCHAVPLSLLMMEE